MLSSWLVAVVAAYASAWSVGGCDETAELAGPAAAWAVSVPFAWCAVARTNLPWKRGAAFLALSGQITAPARTAALLASAWPTSSRALVAGGTAAVTMIALSWLYVMWPSLRE